MATTIKKRKKRENETMADYTMEIGKDIQLGKGEMIEFNPETGDTIVSSTDEFIDRVHQSRNMKKINFWLEESLIEDIKALQFISGGINLTEAVTFIIKDFFIDFSETEEYKLYMKLRDKIQKK